MNKIQCSSDKMIKFSRIIFQDRTVEIGRVNKPSKTIEAFTDV
jgi:hypothetical protein